MLPEVVSPNVKYFTPNPWLSFVFKNARAHSNGVIEIETHYGAQSKLTKTVEQMFTKYEIAGAVYPVNTTGLELSGVDTVGSERFCSWDAVLANQLTEVIKNMGAVDILPSGEKFAGVSRYFRFMRYMRGGEHYPHYDSDFEGPGYTTRYSLVMYFTDCESGEIAFIKKHLNEVGTYATDWARQARDNEIELKIKPQVGKIVIFPHTLCHTVLPYTDPEGSRIIARGDLVFTA